MNIDLISINLNIYAMNKTFNKGIIWGFAMIAICFSMIFYSCQKNLNTASVNYSPITAELLSTNKEFIVLNDEVSRFDPQYLKTVYHDNRSLEDISIASQSLIEKISKDPNNGELLKQFALFYHFSSVDDLVVHSNILATSFKALNDKFDFNKKLLSPNSFENRVAFSHAKKIYASNKYQNLLLSRNAPTVKSNSTARVNSYIEQLEEEQMIYLYNLQFEPTLEDGGGIDCKGEQCCTDRINCRLNAENSFIDDLIKYGGGGFAGGFTLGGAAGSLVATPAVGVVTGLFSGLISGTLGVAAAYQRRQNNLQICENNYSQCMAKKGS
jgi:hypothetical protein